MRPRGGWRGAPGLRAGSRAHRAVSPHSRGGPYLVPSGISDRTPTRQGKAESMDSGPLSLTHRAAHRCHEFGGRGRLSPPPRTLELISEMGDY